jgi:predicted nucleotidyltransferase
VAEKSGLGALVAERELWDCVIYRCVVGSQAYGLAGEGSDVDRRGFYLPPADLHWSLYGVPEQLENDEAQESYWEIQKLLIMALKANPNVLECLYTPLVETCAPVAAELIAERSRLLSRLIHKTYNGYVLSQFKKLEQDIRTTGAIKWKHAMHLIRLLLAGITGLEEGTIPVRVDDGLRERLLAIKRNEVPWPEVNAWRLDLHARFDRAFAGTSLPERPDYAWANDYLVRARRSAL